MFVQFVVGHVIVEVLATNPLFHVVHEHTSLEWSFTVLVDFVILHIEMKVKLLLFGTSFSAMIDVTALIVTVVIVIVMIVVVIAVVMVDVVIVVFITLFMPVVMIPIVIVIFVV